MMIRLETKNYNMILTEKQTKYQLYHPLQLINMNLTGEDALLLDQKRVIEQTDLFFFRKTFGKINKND